MIKKKEKTHVSENNFVNPRHIYIQFFFFSICVGYSFTLHLQLTSVMHKLINNHVSNEHYCTNSFTFYLETCIRFI